MGAQPITFRGSAHTRRGHAAVHAGWGASWVHPRTLPQRAHLDCTPSTLSFMLLPVMLRVSYICRINSNKRLGRDLGFANADCGLLSTTPQSPEAASPSWRRGRRPPAARRTCTAWAWRSGSSFPTEPPTIGGECPSGERGAMHWTLLPAQPTRLSPVGTVTRGVHAPAAVHGAARARRCPQCAAATARKEDLSPGAKFSCICYKQMPRSLSYSSTGAGPPRQGVSLKLKARTASVTVTSPVTAVLPAPGALRRYAEADPRSHARLSVVSGNSGCRTASLRVRVLLRAGLRGGHAALPQARLSEFLESSSRRSFDVSPLPCGHLVVNPSRDNRSPASCSSFQDGVPCWSDFCLRERGHCRVS